MLYYAQPQMHTVMPTEVVMPVVVGAVPANTMGYGGVPRFNSAVYIQPNPTLAQYRPAQPQPQGFHPQPVTSCRRVTRHNPYATVVTPVAAQTIPSGEQEMQSRRPSSMSMDNALGFVMPRQLQQAMFQQQPSMDSSMSDLSALKRGHNAFVTTEELMSHAGTLADISRTAHGSSFVQSALREGYPQLAQNVSIIGQELIPAATSLLLDPHGCYVVKSLMEKLPPAELQCLIQQVTCDPALVFHMCTSSLHTRRVVQFMLDSSDVQAIAEVLIQRCAEVSMSQQGCIVMQRAMDVTPEPLRAQLFSTIFDNIVPFAQDPFGNYVLQHMLEVCDPVLVSSAIARAFRGRMLQLCCNKFASNVLEKAMFHIDADAQEELLRELYVVDEDVLLGMLEDSFGNYFIQSSIALAPQSMVPYIHERLRMVLPRTPYGHKIELRLERRLKGRPVGTRSSQIGANSKTSRQKPSNAGGFYNNNNNQVEMYTEEMWSQQV